MRKARLIGLMVAVAVALALVLAPTAGAAGATTPRAASGTWTWVTTGAEGVDVGGGDTFVTGTEDGTWTGTFQGTSVDYFAGLLPADGSAYGALTVVFRGKIEHARGGFVMHLSWQAPPLPNMLMWGKWTIVTARGGLKHLLGSGTWITFLADDDTPLNAATYEGTYWRY